MISAMSAMPTIQPLVAASAIPNKDKEIVAERFKSKLCKTFVKTGVCPYEHRCMFAHGQHELRTKEMNIADGVTTEESIKEFQRKARGAEFAKKTASMPARSTYGASTSVPTVTIAPVAPAMPEKQQPQAVYYPGYGYLAPGEYADYEGPCQCDDCLAYRANSCDCDECQRARDGNCYCDECEVARHHEHADSSCGSDNHEFMAMP